MLNLLDMNTESVFPVGWILNYPEHCQHFIIPSSLQGSRSRYQEWFHNQTFIKKRKEERKIHQKHFNIKLQTMLSLFQVKKKPMKFNSFFFFLCKATLLFFFPKKWVWMINIFRRYKLKRRKKKQKRNRHLGGFRFLHFYISSCKFKAKGLMA